MVEIAVVMPKRILSADALQRIAAAVDFAPDAEDLERAAWLFGAREEEEKVRPAARRDQCVAVVAAIDALTQALLQADEHTEAWVGLAAQRLGVNWVVNDWEEQLLRLRSPWSLAVALLDNETGGGRPAAHVPAQIAAALARSYRKTTGKKPTSKFAGGRPVTPFARLTTAFFREVDQHLNWSAVERASRAGISLDKKAET